MSKKNGANFLFFLTRLLQQNKPEEALPFLEEARRLDPENVLAKVNLGGAYILSGQHARAVPILEEAVAMEPEDAQIWVNLAAAYLGKLPFATREKRGKAIAALKRSLRIDPQGYSVHYNIALIYREQGDLEQAMYYFQEALRVNPEDEDAQRWLKRLQERASASVRNGYGKAGGFDHG